MFGILAVAAAAAGALTVAIVPDSSAASPRLSESQIRSIALGFASSFGDPTPSSVEYVQNRRDQVVHVAFGATVPDARLVDLIVVRGHFVLDGVPRPLGAPAPTGSCLLLVIDAATGQLTDLGVQDRLPNVSSLGHLIADDQ